MYRSRFKRLALLFVSLPVVLLAVLLALTWAAFRRQQLDRELAAAVQNNDTTKAIRLLTAGADANTTATTEHLSFSQTLQRFLDILRSRRKSIATSSGNPILVTAVINENEPLVIALLDHGALVDAVCTEPDSDGIDVYEGPNKGDTPLLLAAEKDQIRLVSLLLSRHANVNKQNRDGLTALMLTTQASIARMLLDHDADVHVRAFRPKDETALFYASDVAFVQLLLSHGASIEEKAEDGQTVLMKAASDLNIPKVDFLLDRGADTNAIDNIGWTALMYATNTGTNHAMMIRELLRRGADPNLRDMDGDAALFIAADVGAAPIVQMLIHAGAKINLRNHRGQTALRIAKRGEGLPRGTPYQECIRLLEQAGAKE